MIRARILSRIARCIWIVRSEKTFTMRVPTVPLSLRKSEDDAGFQIEKSLKCDALRPFPFRRSKSLVTELSLANICSPMDRCQQRRDRDEAQRPRSGPLLQDSSDFGNSPKVHSMWTICSLSGVQKNDILRLSSLSGFSMRSRRKDRLNGCVGFQGNKNASGPNVDGGGCRASRELRRKARRQPGLRRQNFGG